jgi:hypothetical protein
MAPASGPNLYPRNTLKRIVRAHANRTLSKNVDILVCLPNYQKTQQLTAHAEIFLDYTLFLQEYVIPFSALTFLPMW